jgi:hypothetical protein
MPPTRNLNAGQAMPYHHNHYYFLFFIIIIIMILLHTVGVRDQALQPTGKPNPQWLPRGLQPP